MKQLIEDRYIGAKVGDTIGVVDRRGFIAPDSEGSSGSKDMTKPIGMKPFTINAVLEVKNVQ